MRFLLVEDNPDDRLLMVYTIGESSDGSSHHTYAEAETVEEAITQVKLADATQGQFDAILLDLSLPDSRDPETTFQRVKLHAHPTPIVVYSGQEDLSIMPRLLKQGAANYLIKGPTVKSIVVLYLLEQAAREARARDIATIERRTAAKGILAEAVALRKPLEEAAKSLPPSAQVDAYAAATVIAAVTATTNRLDALIDAVSRLTDRESQQSIALRELSDTGKHDARKTREVADRLEQIAHEARLEARKSQVEATEAKQEVQKLKDVFMTATPMNRAKVLAGVGGLITAGAAIWEVVSLMLEAIARHG